MIRTSHIGAFLAGTVVACAVGAVAAPSDSRTRFTRLDAFARALHLAQTEYVDDVDEATMINNAIAGMTHGLDRYSTYLSPQRYHRMIEDTEGEYASVGLTIGPGAIDDAHPNLPPYPWIDDVAVGSPAEAAGVLPDDRLVAVNGNLTTKAGKETADASQWEAQLRGDPGTRVKLLVLRAGSKEPRELSLVRARMMELLAAEKSTTERESLFLLGLLSLADVIMQVPLDKALAPLALAPRFADAVAASPRHRTAGFMAKRDELLAGHDDIGSESAPVFGQQMWNYYVRSYPEVVAAHFPGSV